MRPRATTKVTRRATSTKSGPSQSAVALRDERTRWGSGPKAIKAVFSRTRATPSIKRICISWGASMMRLTSPRWTASPRPNRAAAQTRKAR